MATAPEETQKVNRPRLENATLPITAIAGAALLVGSYFYSGLLETQRTQVAATQAVAAEVRATRETLSAINARVGVLEDARSRSERLDERVREIERRQAVLDAKINGGGR